MRNPDKGGYTIHFLPEGKVCCNRTWWASSWGTEI